VLQSYVQFINEATSIYDLHLLMIQAFSLC
jgi:hypothetical protein